MSRMPILALLAITFVTSTGCDTGPHAATGFRLPPDGAVERGQTAFVAYECNTCHNVAGTDMHRPATEPARTLGGVVARPVTDGYLVTSIINPSHAISGAAGKAAPMPDYTGRMTVRELTDLVAFLQSRYVVQSVRTNPVVY